MKSRNNGSRIFMTELMFSILFFIIVSAVCIQCFAGSYRTSKEAKELTEAVNLATNTAEQYLAADTFTNFTDYYNDNWEKTDAAEGQYKLTAMVEEAASAKECQVMHVTVATMDDEELYSLEVKKAIH